MYVLDFVVKKPVSWLLNIFWFSLFILEMYCNGRLMNLYSKGQKHSQNQVYLAFEIFNPLKKPNEKSFWYVTLFWLINIFKKPTISF